LSYLWQKQALEHLATALQNGRTARGEAQTTSADRARIAALEATIVKKDRVIAEVSEEYLDKKALRGNVWVTLGPTARCVDSPKMTAAKRQQPEHSPAVRPRFTHAKPRSAKKESASADLGRSTLSNESTSVVV